MVQLIVMLINYLDLVHVFFIKQARKIEESIELTRRDMVHPTEVEIELKKRLDQLTDRLIQKQMQVHSLCGLFCHIKSCLFSVLQHLLVFCYLFFFWTSMGFTVKNMIRSLY